MTTPPSVHALQQHPAFRNASLRLLSDFLGWAGGARKVDRAWDKGDTSIGGSTHLVLVEQGTVEILTEVTEDTETRTIAFLRSGDLWARPDLDVPYRARAADARALATWYEIDVQALLEVPELSNRAVPALLAVFSALDGVLTAETPSLLKPQRLWITEEPGLGTPVVALAELLASSITRQFPRDTVALHELDDTGPRRLRVWRSGAFDDDEVLQRELEELAGIYAPLAALEGLLGAGFLYLVVNRQSPHLLPAVDQAEFERILHLLPREPTGMPARLRVHLAPAQRNDGDPGGEPLFSSYLPTVVVDPGRARSRAFTTRPVDQATPRHVRDLQRLRIDSDAVRARWNDYQEETDSPGRFAQEVLAQFPGLRASADRWARGALNRRLGVALSGGGATSYRMVPFLRGLEERGIPVDVVSGVSGGAGLGAYYCRDGCGGLTRLVENGPAFSMLTAAASVLPNVWEHWLDWDLAHTRIEELETRYVPITVELPPAGSPRGVVIETGTLGNAVQLSGAAPVVFAPATRAYYRYVDGAAATLLPVEKAVDYGADLVVAANTLAPPRQRNPIADLPFGPMLYWLTPLGRFIDLWITGAYATGVLSDRQGENADVYFKAKPTRDPFVEAPLWYRARNIVENAENDPDLAPMVADVEQRWQSFV